MNTEKSEEQYACHKIMDTGVQRHDCDCESTPMEILSISCCVLILKPMHKHNTHKIK